jgi:FKBP-type peptidyl-prolyl cis-trans isomerase SlpA
MKVDHQSRIQLNFSLSLPDGQQIDSNFSGDPVAMQLGDGKMMTGFEAHLIGMSKGDIKEVLVPAANAFGEYNSDNLQQFDLASFSPDVALEEGLVVNFADAAGAELPGVVNSISNTKVVVDFNHPLAGRDIIFKVKIASVDDNNG